jgi:hypothetical protein
LLAVVTVALKVVLLQAVAVMDQGINQVVLVLQTQVAGVAVVMEVLQADQAAQVVQVS